ncbi:hypothetical protein LCGC14_1512720 [marine sediment metagenome]|uniref:Uncharacterized protein n=1 Tax=marine sediment metagenome TaxID=412755 RepID=A0A0F9JLQ9_9ZZZZ
MTILVDIKKKKNLEALQNSFLSLIEESEGFEDKEKAVSLSKQLRKTTEEWHASFEPKIQFEEKKIIQLKEDIDTYSDLIDEKAFKKNVMNTYLLNKPGSSIGIHNKNPVRIDEFIAGLNIYFFVDFIISSSMKSEYTWTIYISRLKELNKMAVAHHHKYNGNHNFYADAIGFLSGYTPKQIWNHCQEKGFQDLIK